MRAKEKRRGVPGSKCPCLSTESLERLRERRGELKKTDIPPWKLGAPERFSLLSPCWTLTWTQRQQNK
ncbi:hypothetical protein AMECASPLE_017482 [Ameca splendens]|uniref:Uncharacterized protein n=1 Tax=Ameca splendens TaxID=208324 RepID=A0ABV0Y2W6_9TELE